MSTPAEFVAWEEGKSLSDSLLWDLQRSFFDSAGVEAFSTLRVPNWSTTNPYLADHYAEVILQFVFDLSSSGRLQEAHPVHVLEVGAGSGKLGFHILSALERKCSERGIEQLPIRYVMTDFTARNVEFWEKHPLLQPFLQRGQLDFSVFDAERDTSLTLRLSGETLSPGCLKNPLFAIANYVFCSLRSDAFSFQEGSLKELKVSLLAPAADLAPFRDAPGGEPPPTMNSVKLRFHATDFDPSTRYAGRPSGEQLSQLLSLYRDQITEGGFLLPVGAIACLDVLDSLSEQGFLLLACDKGYFQIEEMRAESLPYLATHGSVSLPVNFHALGTWARLREAGELMGEAITDLSLALLTSRLSFAELPRSTAWARQCAQTFSPGDYHALNVALLGNSASPVQLKSIVAHIRHSRGDPQVVVDVRDKIRARLAEVSKAQRLKVGDEIQKACRNFYWFPGVRDFPFEMGVLLHLCECFDEALEQYAESTRWFGESSIVSFNRGLCLLEAGRPLEARAALLEAKQLGAEAASVDKWLARIPA